MEVNKDVHDQLILADHVNYMKSELASQKQLQRKVIEEMNQAIALDDAVEWQDRRKGPKKKTAASPSKKKRMMTEIYDESEDGDMDMEDVEGEDDETYFAVPRLVRSFFNFL